MMTQPDHRDCRSNPGWGTGGVAQAVKLLLHKHKAPSSNTSPTKNKNNNRHKPRMGLTPKERGSVVGTVLEALDGG
jgi:hypothetical protein